MYKVYLDVEFHNKINKAIVDKINEELIKQKDIIVFLNETEFEDKIKKINELLPDIYVCLSESQQYKGIACITDDGHDERSSGLAKEIYKCLKTIYYVENSAGVIYVSDERLKQITCPCTKVYIGNVVNKSDNVWKEKEYVQISKKISEGIIKYFKLKLC